MISRLVFLLFCGVIIPELGNTQLFLRARRTSDLTIPYCPPGYYWTPNGLIEARAPLLKREPLRVLINATGDTIVMKFLRPSPSIKLEGYILGYGSSFYSKQYIPFPENGKPFVTEIEAEPKYLISVQQVQPVQPMLSLRKYCATSQITRQKPLHLVVGTLTPTSVLLSWGILIKAQKSGILMNDCLEDRMYTVRYRENEKKNWLFQSCPTTETVVDKLKPETVYEFGVKDKDDRSWSNRVIHKMETYREKVPGKTNLPEKSNKSILVHMDRKENKVHFRTPKPVRNETRRLPSYLRTTTHPPIVTETKSVPAKILKGSFKPSPSATIFHEKTQPTLATTESNVGSPVPRDYGTLSLQEIKLASSEPELEHPESKSHDRSALPANSQASSEPELEHPKSKSHDRSALQANPHASSEPELEHPKSKSHDRSALPANPHASSGPELEHPESKSHDRSALPANPQATPEVELESPLDKIHTTHDLTETLHVTVDPEKEASVSTTYATSELPESEEATNEPESETVLYKSYIIPGLPKTHEATDERNLEIPLHKSYDTSALPTSQQVAKGLELETPVHKTPETPLSPEIRHATNEPKLEIPMPRSHVTPDLPDIQKAASGIPHSDTPNKSKQIFAHVFPEEIPALTETPQQQSDNFAASPKDDVASASLLSETPQQQSDNFATSTKADVASAISLSETQQESEKSASSDKDDVAQDLPALNEATQDPIKPETPFSEHQRAIIAPNGTPLSDIPTESKPTYGFELSDKILETPQQSDSYATPVKDDTARSLPALHGTPPSEITNKALPTYARVMPEEIHVPTEAKQESDKSMVSIKDDLISTLPASNESSKEPVKPQISFPDQTSAAAATNETVPEYYTSVTSLPEESWTTKAYFETSSPDANDASEMLQTNLVQSDKEQRSSKPRTPDKHPVSQPNVTVFGYDQQLLVPQKPQSPDTAVIPVTSLVSSEKLEERVRPQMISATVKPQAPNKTRPKIENNTQSRRHELVKPVTGSVTSVSQTSTLSGTARNRTTRPPVLRYSTPRARPRKPQPPRPNTNTRKPLPPNQIPGKPGIKEATLRPVQSSSTIRSSSRSQTVITATYKENGQKINTTAASDKTYTDSPAIFSSTPTSPTDMMGEDRFIAPHVLYIPKNESDPCSITDTVRYFPDAEASEQNITMPPQQPPSNLTVFTVEGCPSFVVLNWTNSKNDTATEYIVTSRVNGTTIPGKGKDVSIHVTNQTHSIVENLMANTSYLFQVTPSNILGQGPPSNEVEFYTESADPRVNEYISGGKDAIWTEIRFKPDTYSECHGKQFVKRTWYKKFVGVQLCNSLRYKIYLSDSLGGTFYNIGDQSGYGEDHCQFVDSFFDGKTGRQLQPDQLPTRPGYYRSVRQEPVQFGKIGENTQTSYVHWYECGTTIPGKW